jgi:23S rRNA pseudouridine1911/1915/1917 synthase
MQEFKFNVTADDKSLRLDKFLVEKFAKIKPEISRSRIKNLIEANKISIDGKKIITNCAYKIKVHEELWVEIPDLEASEIIPKDIKIDIVWEDENMMVINKPAGLTTHPGNGNHQDTLVNALLFHSADEWSGIGGVARPGIVHRLDKDTSGLMVVAKNDLAHQNLALQIQERTLKRNYLAICYGVPKPLNGIIDKNLGRGKINRMKMTVMKLGGKKAVTNYSVQKIYQNSLLSLVECRLETGRTHQIRVHMSAIGHSLVGDQVYGARKKNLNGISEDLQNLIDNFPRQALHSYKIAFLHPISKQEMEFTVDLPQDMRNLLSLIDK